MVNNEYMVKFTCFQTCWMKSRCAHNLVSPTPSDQSSAHIMNIHFIPEVNSAAADGNCAALALSGCNSPAKLLGLSYRQEEEGRV